MSAFIVTSPPDTIKLYATCPLPAHVLAGIQRDFDLGAHKGYGESVSLEVSSRRDLHGLSIPEDVLHKLEAEGSFGDSSAATGYEAFLIADEATIREAQEGRYVVWYVEGWSNSDVLSKDSLDPNAEVEVDEKGRYNFAAKNRFYAYAVPITFVNREIGNTSLEESLKFPYNPFGPHKPQDAGADWRLQPPFSAYVLADASHYETKSSASVGNPPMRLGAPQPEEMQLYRLKKETADEIGVISDWTVGNWFDHRTRTHRPEIMEKAKKLDPQTCMMIMVEWKWEAPVL